MTLLIVYLLIALVFSFYCSIAEAVLLSVRNSYVRALEREGVSGAKTLRRLKDDLDRPLAAILTVNTVAHTVGAAGVGAQAAAIYGDNYLGVASAILTILILVLSEIIPKSLGAIYWHKLALPLAPVILGMTRLLAPFVWMSRRITRLFAHGAARRSIFNRSEVEAMAAAGVEEGHIDEKQMHILSNILRLGDISVREIMTPRAVIFSVSKDMTVSDFLNEHALQPFSRIPVFGDDSDDVIGYVLKDELLLDQAKNQKTRTLATFNRTILAVPDLLSVLEVFDAMLHEDLHLVLVVNEYGEVQGLVTLEDVVETLLGLEIIDETDTVEDMQVLALEKWRDRMNETDDDPTDPEAERGG